jgi:hypothetical protein
MPPFSGRSPIEPCIVEAKDHVRNQWKNPKHEMTVESHGSETLRPLLLSVFFKILESIRRLFLRDPSLPASFALPAGSRNLAVISGASAPMGWTSSPWWARRAARVAATLSHMM